MWDDSEETCFSPSRRGAASTNNPSSRAYRLPLVHGQTFDSEEFLELERTWIRFTVIVNSTTIAPVSLVNTSSA
jgi:hypothetical protein